MVTRFRLLLILVCIGVVQGCSDTERGGEALATGVGSADPTGDSAGPTGGSASSSDGSSGTEEGNSSTTPGSGPGSDRGSTSGGESTSDSGASGSLRFDTPSGAEGGDDANGDVGCDKIDFLFVIDNSGSMQTHQTNLLNSFGPFIDTIISTVSGNDYRIMVLDSDACVNGGGGGWPPAGPPPKYCSDGCDGVLGAGQVRDCDVPGAVRYLTSALDVATLKSTFQCIASVGVTGSGDEMPMTALVEAIGPLNQSGQCNAAFVRDDAILVVTIISDDHSGWEGYDNENGFGGTPQSWYDAVIAVKGKPENVVVLGLYMSGSDFSCDMSGSPREAEQFIEFTNKFGSQGFIGSVCALDYNNPFFQNAVVPIDTACENFVPPE